jgi:diguanylate cyclase (GGDEF)-like protein
MDMAVPLAALLFFSAVCYMLLAARLYAQTNEIGYQTIGLTFVVIGLWILGGAAELLATSYVIFSIGRIGHFVGTTILPLTLLVYFRQYTGRPISRNIILLLMIVPIVSIAIAATNYWHEFMWYLPATNAEGEFLTRPNEWGPWFLFLHVPYNYLIVSLSILTLMMHSTAVAPAHRIRLFMLVGATAVPIAAIVAYDLGYGSNTISLLPIVLTAMLPAYAWLFISEKFVGFSPLAYETVFQNMQDPVVVVDDNRRVIGLNNGAEQMLKMNETSALRASLESVFGEEVPEVYEALETGKPTRMMTATGRYLHVQVSPIISDGDQKRADRVLMFRDVSDVEKAARDVRNSELMLRTLVDHSVNGIVRLRWSTDENGNKSLRCIFANAAAGRFLDTDSDSMIGQSADELIKLASSGLDSDEAADMQNKFRVGTERGEVVDTEARIGEMGTGKWMRVIGEPVGDDVAVTFVDLTDTKAKEFRMASIAWSDPLTGVLNRRGFERDATRHLANSDDDANGALVFIDLNDFKSINDRCGHSIGDQILVIVAERLRNSLRACDIIGRLGGDEFVALVPNVNAEIAQILAERLTQFLEMPYLIENESLACPSSIGLALYPEHASTLTGLLRVADQAMYRAKARGRGITEIGTINRLEKAM